MQSLARRHDVYAAERMRKISIDDVKRRRLEPTARRTSAVKSIQRIHRGRQWQREDEHDDGDAAVIIFDALLSLPAQQQQQQQQARRISRIVGVTRRDAAEVHVARYHETECRRRHTKRAAR